MKKKKPIPDVTEILENFDEKTKFAVRNPEQAKEKAMNELLEEAERINNSVFKDIRTVTIGDYINSALNYQVFSSSSAEKSSYFIYYVLYEQQKRLKEHNSYVN